MSSEEAGAGGRYLPCVEVFDENSQPSVEEISEYAQQIGIDPINESYLLPLAEDGLMRPLPAPWKACYDVKLKAHYFYNRETKVTQWDHPIDEVYKNLVVKARQVSEHIDSNDTYVSIQDLISYERDQRETNDTKSDFKSINKDEDSSIESSLEEMSHSKSFNYENSSKNKSSEISNLSAPIMKRPMLPLNSVPNPTEKNKFYEKGIIKKTGESNTFPRTSQLDSSFKNESFMKNNKSSTKNAKLTKQTSEIIDLSFNPNRKESVDNEDIELERPIARKGLTLMGGGSIFLKANRSNQNNVDKHDKEFFSNTTSSQNNETQTIVKTTLVNENPKSILRDRTFGDLFLKNSVHEKNEGIKYFDIEEDKKSVRFNLEQDVNIPYDYSPSPSSNSSSDIVMDGNQNSVILGNRNITSELSNSDRIILRRNSESSVPSLDNTNLVKNAKLNPLVYHDNMKPPNLHIVKDQFSKSRQYSASGKIESTSVNISSPTRKLIKPNPGDFIKPNLFQKPFEKLSDILKTTSPDTDSESKKLLNNSPISPPPVKRKLSINLMESVDSEASTESPEKETVNILIEKETKINDFKEIKNNKESQLDYDTKDIKRNIINKMTTLNEDIVYDVSNNSAELKVDMQRKTIKNFNEEKDILEKQFKQEIDEMKEKLQNEHIQNKIKMNEAIAEAQRDHDENLKGVLKKLNLELNAKRENAIQEEKNKCTLEFNQVLKHINDEHVVKIEEIKHQKKIELIKIMSDLEDENIKNIEELKAQYADNFESEKTRLIMENKSDLDKMKVEHEALCDELKKDYRSEVELVRGQQAAHLSALRDKLRRDREPCRPPAALSPPSLISPRDETSYERLRCDKRLLEDKYRCLKEKYARLKSDVKISIERRNKRREQSLTTGSETEKSHSHRTAEKSAEAGGDPNSLNLSGRSGKRSATVGNGIVYGPQKNINSNETSATKESCSTNNNINCENKDMTSFQNNLASQKSNQTPITNFLTVNDKNVNYSIPDQSRGKSFNIRDKSPMGRALQKSFNYENDNSIGINDVSLSQSDSHTVSNNKYHKKVNITDNLKVEHKKAHDKQKVIMKKSLQRDLGYADTTVTDYHDSSDTGTSEHRNIKESLIGKNRKKIFTRLKSASTSRLNYSISSKLNERACSPVENLRQQLRKLEDLEEQFPDIIINADTTAYRLRYPFPDSASGGVSGGELGFLRHRALVEREGIRRARAVLRRRADLLRQRRRLAAAWPEECELTDMEVSLHRTKSILGEKVIRLRHIEKSLRRIQDGQECKDVKTDTNVQKQKPPDNKDTTLSDISSHSSGFSSTEGHSDTNRNNKNPHSIDYDHSSEIINSLQTLNTEIRDIWQVLNSQQQLNVAKVIPIGQLLYTDVGWQLPIAASNIPNIQSLPNSMSLNAPVIKNAAEDFHINDKLQNYRQISTIDTKPSQVTVPLGGVATSLVERTRDLRDWLKQQAAL